MLKKTWAAAALVVAVVLGGCSTAPRMGKYNIEVSMDPELAQRTGGAPQVQVDLVGVNDTEYQRWVGESMSKYWAPNSDVRSESKLYRSEASFGPGNTATKVLKKNDPMWDTWKKKGAMHLLVLADLPGAQADRPGAEDGRRLILPLDKARWSKTDTIKILVQRTRLTCTTPPDPPKK